MIGNRYLISTIYLAILVSFGCAKKEQGDFQIENLPSPNASSLVESMATGFNLGNTFDVGLQSTEPASIYPVIDLYADVGMRHVRIPVTWMEGFDGNTLADDQGQINFEHPRFLQLKAVIDYALRRGLYVVINAHHEREFKENYDGSGTFNRRFSTLWKGIATYFKEYPFALIFELLNEPEGAFGDWSGRPRPSDEQAIAFTRQIYNVGYEAIRETAGRNATRVLMISTNGQGNHSTIDEVYPTKSTLPGGGQDSYLAIQVHTYDPWAFCGQNGSNQAYPGKGTIENALRTVAAHARTLEVPVNYGEYGVGRASNASERDTDLVREFYRIMVETTLDEKMSSTVWDDRGWFGLIEMNGPGSYQFIYDIVPTMLAH